VSPRAPRPPALRYRPARRTDVETLADLGWRAYRVSSLEKRREFYTDHPRFGLRDVRVGEMDGQVVASLVLYPFTAFVRGQRVPVTGIGSVAVSPEHRRRGIAEMLLKTALREMRQRGDALSALYPFRDSFYRRLGYGVIEVAQQLAFSPALLPASDEARRVRRLMLPDRPSVEALYERVALQGHFGLARRAEWWTQRLWTRTGDWVVYEGRRRGQLEGYLYYEVDSDAGPFKLAVTLTEFVASTPEAHRGLVGHLASLSDQVSEIHHIAPGDNSWLALLKTSQNLRPAVEMSVYHDTGNLVNGLMLRLNDVKSALEHLPVSTQARGEIALEVDDEVVPQNARAYRVRASEGRLKVSPESSRAGRTRLPRLVVEPDVLASMVGGALSPVRAAELGLVDASGGAAEVIDRWFRTRPAFVYPLNAF
jgi:predicted acetyltransferase